MARPRGSKNKPKDDAPSVGHNSAGEMSDADRKALTFMHRRQYVELLDVKKAADAALRNLCKTIKAELGSTALSDIKLMSRIKELGDNSLIKTEIARLARVAEWMAMPVGVQIDLFGEPDRAPLTEKAAREGEVAGLEGKSPSSPYGDADATQAWLKGWHKGQDAIKAKFLANNPTKVIQGGMETPIEGNEFDDALAGTDDDDDFTPESDAAALEAVYGEEG